MTREAASLEHVSEWIFNHSSAGLWRRAYRRCTASRPVGCATPCLCVQLVSAAEAAAAEAAAAAAEEAAKGAAPSLGLFGLGTRSIIRKAEAEVRWQMRRVGPSGRL